MPKRIIALDWESFYDDECTITKLGNRAYFNHPKFDAYMLSAVSDDGIRWVGHPRDFDWSLIEDAHVLSHNASFDEGLYLELVRKGEYPDVKFAAWDCTMDLCAYHGVRRSLKNAVKDLFDIELSKETRDDMKGLDWETMTPEFRKEVEDYAIADAEWCLKVWQKLSPAWPEHERRISRHTRTMCRRGVAVDEQALRKAIEDLTVIRFELETEIPWTEHAKLKSRKAFDEQCRKHGIVPPKSLAKSSPEAEAWFDKHESDHPWIHAYRNVGRANTFLKKLQNLERQVYEGRYHPSINYFGAHTGRFSSGGGSESENASGVNLQNLPRETTFGVDFRGLFIPSPGKKLIVVDQAQIEVRTTLWLAGDAEALAEIAKTDDLYHALAVMFDIWSDDRGPLRDGDKALRQGVKTIGLGVQFGASAGKVASIAKIPLAEASRWVNLFTTRFKSVVKLWKRLETAMKRARVDPSRTCEFRMPSGTVLRYRNIRYAGDGLVCTVLKGRAYSDMRVWHGVLMENAAQKLARDVICDDILRVEDAGYPVLFHTHDEVIAEVDDDKAEAALEDICRIMRQPPAWIPDIPLDVEGSIMSKYGK